MLPAALRRRLDRLNGLQSSFLASQQEQIDTAKELTYMSEVDFGYYVSKGQPFTNPSSRPTSAGSKGSTISVSADASGASTPEMEKPSTLLTYEVSSGLRWNRVAPAFSLLRNAGFEAQQPNADPRLVRSLYIDSLGYMLEALPPDLTAEETRLIHARLPEPIKANIGSSSSSTSQKKSGSSNAPSYLHRSIAALIVYGFILVQLILPYMRMLLQSLHRYERRYHLTERILSTALDTADGFGKGAHNIGSTLTTLGEGRVITAMGNLTGWLMESVAGGVYDGVSEGLIVLGTGQRPYTEMEKRGPQ